MADQTGTPPPQQQNLPATVSTRVALFCTVDVEGETINKVVRESMEYDWIVDAQGLKNRFVLMSNPADAISKKNKDIPDLTSNLTGTVNSGFAGETVEELGQFCEDHLKDLSADLTNKDDIHVAMFFVFDEKSLSEPSLRIVQWDFIHDVEDWGWARARCSFRDALQWFSALGTEGGLADIIRYQQDKGPFTQDDLLPDPAL